MLAHNNAPLAAVGRTHLGLESSSSTTDASSSSSSSEYSVVSFAPVPSVALWGASDPHGFALVSRLGQVAMFRLPDELPPDSYREEVTVGRCADLGCTPRHVVYLHKAAVEKKPVSEWVSE